MATAPFRLGQALGFQVSGAPTGGTVTMNAAATLGACAFVPDAARTLSTFRVNVSTKVGTLASTDISCSVYDSSGTGGAPGTQLAAGPYYPSATITAVGWYTFTGMSLVLTAGQMYWVVFANGNATPATNYAAVQFLSGCGEPFLLGTATRQFWGRGSSVNAGTTWTVVPGYNGFRVGYADGSFDGVPVGNVGATAAAYRAFAANEVGVQFTSPANAGLSVSGLAVLAAAATGAPTGTPRLGLWTGPSSGPTNLGYVNLPATAITTGQYVSGYFSAPISIPPNTTCYVTLGETGGGSDTSSNAWNLEEYTMDTDANSLILFPVDGTMRKAYLGSGTWTITSTGIYAANLLLNPAGEFNPQLSNPINLSGNLLA